jgi:hypothetical protein
VRRKRMRYKIIRLETYTVIVEAESEEAAMDKLYSISEEEWGSVPDDTEVWAEEADYV